MAVLQIKDFLLNNGFKESYEDFFENELCSITIIDGYYHVKNNDGCSMYSSNLNIYWLIGVLTYYGYMDKNYKQ